MLRGSALAVDDTTYQNQMVILKAHKGEVKEHPLVGVGISSIVNDHEFAYWKRLITDEMEKDGQIISRLNVTTTNIELEARYR